MEELPEVTALHSPGTGGATGVDWGLFLCLCCELLRLAEAQLTAVWTWLRPHSQWGRGDPPSRRSGPQHPISTARRWGTEPSTPIKPGEPLSPVRQPGHIFPCRVGSSEIAKRAGLSQVDEAPRLTGPVTALPAESLRKVGNRSQSTDSCYNDTSLGQPSASPEEPIWPRVVFGRVPLLLLGSIVVSSAPLW